MRKFTLRGGPADGKIVSGSYPEQKIAIPAKHIHPRDTVLSVEREHPEIDLTTFKEFTYKARYCRECGENHHPELLFFDPESERGRA